MKRSPDPIKARLSGQEGGLKSYMNAGRTDKERSREMARRGRMGGRPRNRTLAEIEAAERGDRKAATGARRLRPITNRRSASTTTRFE